MFHIGALTREASWDKYMHREQKSLDLSGLICDHGKFPLCCCSGSRRVTMLESRWRSKLIWILANTFFFSLNGNELLWRNFPTSKISLDQKEKRWGLGYAIQPLVLLCPAQESFPRSVLACTFSVDAKGVVVVYISNCNAILKLWLKHTNATSTNTALKTELSMER